MQNIDTGLLSKVLVQQHYVVEEDLKRAIAFAESHNVGIEEYLFAKNIITKTIVGQAFAEYYGVSFADLETHRPLPEEVLLIPEKTSRKHMIVVFSQDKKLVRVATDDPKKRGLKTGLKKIFGTRKVELMYALRDEIEETQFAYRKDLGDRVQSVIKSDTRVAPKILENILHEAVEMHASDIHFEPNERDVVLRFRVDGALIEIARIETKYYENILNRVKILGHLRIDEHAAAQDGSIRFDVNEETHVDIRISIVPTLDGEKIAMRVLSRYVKDLSLSELGFNAQQDTWVQQAVSNPFGMILVTGPTGSGKTTTLYAMLKMLNEPDVNITTIEDPVEYKLLGANQIQVNKATGLTFAQGLRSIVRQDPDIVLVGEIRDLETAEIAVNAALTGHMLFSTFHANNAMTAIPRLIEMGIEPFLLASTLELIVAQRLVRKVCQTCRVSYTVPRADFAKEHPELDRFFDQDDVTLYRGKGCSVCAGTGFRGRVAIFEMVPVSKQFQELILTSPSLAVLEDLARKESIPTLFEHGLEKVRNGVTTISELKRVAIPNYD